MNDVDVTGPLPVIGSTDSPAGWIPQGRSEHSPQESAPEPAEPSLGADPDLPWDFATVPAEPAAPERSEPVTADLPVVGAEAYPETPDEYDGAAAHDAGFAADSGPELAGPVVPPTDDMPTDDTSEETSAIPPVLPPPAPGSRHGQPAPLSRAWNAGVAAVIAVAAVVVGIIAFQHSSGSSSGSGAGPAFVLPTSAPTVGSGANLSSPPPGLSALPKASGGATNAASAGGRAGTASTAATGVPAGAPSITVLNETTTHGLAASEAEKLRGAGWTVRRVTNINARLTQTTVYYDASQEAAAKALMASVPSIKAALPRPAYVLSTGGLIVVVASDAA